MYDRRWMPRTVDGGSISVLVSKRFKKVGSGSTSPGRHLTWNIFSRPIYRRMLKMNFLSLESRKGFQSRSPIKSYFWRPSDAIVYLSTASTYSSDTRCRSTTCSCQAKKPLLSNNGWVTIFVVLYRWATSIPCVLIALISSLRWG